MRNQIKNLMNALDKEGWETWRESFIELPFGPTGCGNCKKDNYDIAIIATVCGIDIEICQLIGEDVVNDINDYIKRT